MLSKTLLSQNVGSIFSPDLEIIPRIQQLKESISTDHTKLQDELYGKNVQLYRAD